MLVFSGVVLAAGPGFGSAAPRALGDVRHRKATRAGAGLDSGTVPGAGRRGAMWPSFILTADQRGFVW